jgi:hypothetical protein
MKEVSGQGTDGHHMDSEIVVRRQAEDGHAVESAIVITNQDADGQGVDCAVVTTGHGADGQGVDSAVILIGPGTDVQGVDSAVGGDGQGTDRHGDHQLGQEMHRQELIGSSCHVFSTPKKNSYVPTTVSFLLSYVDWLLCMRMELYCLYCLALQQSSFIPVCKNGIKPAVGMSFDSIEDVEELYKEYAHLGGFAIRIGSQNLNLDGQIVNKIPMFERRFQVRDQQRWSI